MTGSDVGTGNRYFIKLDNGMEVFQDIFLNLHMRNEVVKNHEAVERISEIPGKKREADERISRIKDERRNVQKRILELFYQNKLEELKLYLDEINKIYTYEMCWKHFYNELLEPENINIVKFLLDKGVDVNSEVKSLYSLYDYLLARIMNRRYPESREKYQELITLLESKNAIKHENDEFYTKGILS